MAGYTNTSITCDDAPDVEVTSVTIGLGETKTCTFVNDDIPASLSIHLEMTERAAARYGANNNFQFTGDGKLLDFVLATLNRIGQVDFSNLDAGSYTVKKNLGTLLEGLFLVTGYTWCDGGSPQITGDEKESATVTLEPGDAVNCFFRVDALEVLASAQVGDTVFLDKNKNGTQDAGEPGINGAKLVLKDADGNIVATLTTATGAWDGFYKFLLNEGIPGTYTVSIDMSSVKSTYELTTASSFTYDIVDGDDIITADFGLYEEELPKTGMNVESIGLLGLMLLALGTAAVLFTRRRREDG
jgi:LPXTG-motif cell wall-anchored protein